MTFRKGHHRTNPATGKKEWVAPHEVSPHGSDVGPADTPTSHDMELGDVAGDTDPLAPGPAPETVPEVLSAVVGPPATEEDATARAELALVDYGHLAVGGLSSVRKARWDARGHLLNVAVALDGKPGMSQPDQVASMREAAREALRAALVLEAAARLAEERDLDAWKDKKSSAGGLGLPALSEDGGFVTDPEQAVDDAVGWQVQKQMDTDQFDDELKGLLDEGQ